MCRNCRKDWINLLNRPDEKGSIRPTLTWCVSVSVSVCAAGFGHPAGPWTQTSIISSVVSVEWVTPYSLERLKEREREWGGCPLGAAAPHWKSILFPDPFEKQIRIHIYSEIHVCCVLCVCGIEWGICVCSCAWAQSVSGINRGAILALIRWCYSCVLFGPRSRVYDVWYGIHFEVNNVTNFLRWLNDQMKSGHTILSCVVSRSSYQVHTRARAFANISTRILSIQYNIQHTHTHHACTKRGACIFIKKTYNIIISASLRVCIMLDAWTRNCLTTVYK